MILLTNRVHPSRNWGSVNPARRAVLLGDGATILPWRYTTDALHQGRGVYVDGVKGADPRPARVRRRPRARQVPAGRLD